jgi:hypothetical protein
MDSQYCYPKITDTYLEVGLERGRRPSSGDSELRFVLRLRRKPPTLGWYPLGSRAVTNNGEDTRVYNETHHKRECAYDPYLGVAFRIVTTDSYLCDRPISKVPGSAVFPPQKGIGLLLSDEPLVITAPCQFPTCFVGDICQQHRNG